MNDVKVSVVEFGDRKTYQLQWLDPITGRKKTKSSGIERTGQKRERTAAEREAAKLEAKLREGRYPTTRNATWQAFREKYETEVLSGLANSTDSKVGGIFDAVERVLNPVRMGDLTADRLSYLQSQLRENGHSKKRPKKLAEVTIAGYMAHLRSALRYAVDWGMLPALPKIPRIKRAKAQKKMKGRPITTEEFERMLEAVPDVVLNTQVTDDDKRSEITASWCFYLRGLWLSGLRLEESLELWWDRFDRLYVDLSARRPVLVIPGELEKGGQDRDCPMAPDFAEFLLAVPQGKRIGRIFAPLPCRRHADQLTKDRVSRVVGAIGEQAGIMVNAKTGKYASAHDLRRSFGDRWARKVMPQVLMELMRHESIETTMRYYVGRNAQATADVLWAAYDQR